MEIRPSGSAASRRAPVDYFTGAVWQDPIVEAPAPGNVRASVVRFEPGARTAWHTHPAGQTLYILSGVGRVQSLGGPIREVRAGDVVRGDKAMRAQSIRGRMELDGLYGPIQAHCPAAEEAGAESNRGQSTVGKYLSALAPKADMPHRQQRLTERAGKGPGSIRHGRLSRVDVEIRSLSFVWAVCTW